MIDALFGFRKLTTVPYGINGPQASASPNTLNVELKNFLQTETISRLMIRVVGNIIIAGAGAGAATGRDNPESLLINCVLKGTPSLGVNFINNVTARGLRKLTAYDRGYDIKATTVPDTAATVPVDFTFVANFKMPGSVNPIEYGLPSAVFSSLLLSLQFGGREQLFSGGTNTWDLTNIQVQVWADYDNGVAGKFHVLELFERSFQVTGTTQDLSLQNLEPGYMYTHMLYRAEQNLALVQTILNSIAIRSAGREWLPKGDVNALEIQRWNRETHISDPNFVQTGLYWVPCLRDGMYTRSIDSTDTRLDVRADVNFTGGTDQDFLILTGRRIIPLGIDASAAATSGIAPNTSGSAAGATGN
jgi:hypothetical protein